MNPCTPLHLNFKTSASLDILKAVWLRTPTFWDMTLRHRVIYSRHFKKTWRLHLQGSVSLICDKCHNLKCMIFQERRLKFQKCYNILWVQRRHNCSPAVSFANCVMTLYLLKVHLQTFLFIPISKKCQILSCDTLVANERDIYRCHRRNGPNFGRMFLMLNYTDITQNTYIPSWTVIEIMAK